MARSKQTRRSVSVKGLTYQRIYNHCQEQEPVKSISGFVEDLVKEKLDALKVAVPREITDWPRDKKPDFEKDKAMKAHFTF